MPLPVFLRGHGTCAAWALGLRQLPLLALFPVLSVLVLLPSREPAFFPLAVLPIPLLSPLSCLLPLALLRLWVPVPIPVAVELHGGGLIWQNGLTHGSLQSADGLTPAVRTTR
ncbi:hypothetical protein Vafri_5367, partial [Volvox africanus]